MKPDLIFVKEAEELGGFLASAAKLDLNDAVVGILDLQDASLRVGVAWPGHLGHGGLNKGSVQVELCNADVQLAGVVQSWKVEWRLNSKPRFFI